MLTLRFTIYDLRWMRAQKIIWLALLLAGFNSLSQTLNLPSRPANAPTGSQFVKIITPMGTPPSAERENWILAQIQSGNVPNFLRTLKPITVSQTINGTNHIATYYVTPDYMAIGTDEDYFLEPMTPLMGQRVANQLGCTLPTRKMVNQIWTNATVKMNPQPIPPSAAMITVPVFDDHNTMVRTQRNAFTNSFPLGALVSGDKKDVIISTKIYTNFSTAVTKPVVIYGWHYTSGSPIQPLYNGHEETYADYSHGVRLVQMVMTVDGNADTVTNVLANPNLARLLSDEGTSEGTSTNGEIVKPRYTLYLMTPVVITHPFSQNVSAGANINFKTLAVGDQPLAYQWKFNGTNLSSATTSILTVTNAQFTNAGSYDVVITNNSGSVTSRPAILKVSSVSYQQFFTDNFNTDSSTNWSFFFDSANGVSDYTTNWAFDYGTTPFTFNGVTALIPPAPNSTDGSTHGVKLTVNGNDSTGTNAAANIYPKNQNFSSNFVFKCDMWLNYPGDAGGSGATGSTQHGLFGINHDGTRPNWAAASASATDGIYFAADGEGGISTDYRAYVGNPSGVQTDLTSNGGGLIASNSTDTIYQNLFPVARFETAGAPGKNWVAVEIRQSNNVIAWKLDDTVVALRMNNSIFTSGTIMLGLMDVFPSIASPVEDSFVIFDNVRVEALAPAAPAKFNAVTRRSDGVVELVCDAASGFSYALEVSTNLTFSMWNQILLLQGSNAPVLITDTNATNDSQRYYRTRGL